METVNGLGDLCDAVDIINYKSSSSDTAVTDDQNDTWTSWLNCIQRVRQECKTPIVCKLPFNQQAIDYTIRRGKSLQEVGCEVHCIKL